MHSWKHCCDRALEHKLERAIHLCRTNLDYRIKYPSEVRANSELKVLTECHPEAKIRILKEHEKILRNAMVPLVERPKRLSRGS